MIAGSLSVSILLAPVGVIYGHGLAPEATLYDSLGVTTEIGIIVGSVFHRYTHRLLPWVMLLFGG